MRVFITGIGGFLGTALARHLYRQGFVVRGSTHKLSGPVLQSKIIEKIYEYNFLNAPKTEWFVNCDAIIHCAYDPHPDSIKRNIAGTLNAFETAATAGVRYQLIISSHTAREDSASAYGQIKHQQEKIFLTRNQAVVRPGLIIGNGGLYKHMRRKILTAPILFLPAPDLAPVYYIYLDDLVISLEKLLTLQQPGEFNLIYPEPISIREFTTQIKKQSGRTALIIPIPLPVILFIVNFYMLFTSTLPTSLQRLRVMHQNTKTPTIHQSTLENFIENPKKFTASNNNKYMSE